MAGLPRGSGQFRFARVKLFGQFLLSETRPDGRHISGRLAKTSRAEGRKRFRQSKGAARFFLNDKPNAFMERPWPAPVDRGADFLADYDCLHGVSPFGVMIILTQRSHSEKNVPDRLRANQAS